MATLVQDILRVGELDRSSQRNKNLSGFNEEVVVHLHERCVHELFEAEAELNPEGLALIAGEKQFSYRELNERANQLAHFLMRFGIGPNSLVGLFSHRTPEMVVGILGILKAGGAYVPLEPRSSSRYLTSIIEDANIFVILTEARLLDKLPKHNGPRLPLDANWEIIAKERRTNPGSRATSKNLAYSIYNTGVGSEPRGVRISHRGLLNYLSWGAEAFQIAKDMESPLDSSISFDLAITRVLGLLMFGRTIYLDPDSAALPEQAKSVAR
ncbi:MAG TPA: AMP-binding protein [Pyrinomonadaceae bacterium]|nr:AMP-binding protein [Pyrinomonadaceae bacterium]